jgi:hypothetical protein
MALCVGVAFARMAATCYDRSLVCSVYVWDLWVALLHERTVLFHLRHFHSFQASRESKFVHPRLKNQKIFPST